MGKIIHHAQMNNIHKGDIGAQLNFLLMEGIKVVIGAIVSLNVLMATNHWIFQMMPQTTNQENICTMRWMDAENHCVSAINLTFDEKLILIAYFR